MAFANYFCPGAFKEKMLKSGLPSTEQATFALTLSPPLLQNFLLIVITTFPGTLVQAVMMLVPAVHTSYSYSFDVL